MDKENHEEYSALIDVPALLKKFRPYLKKYWIVPILLAALLAGFSCWRTSNSFVSMYRSEAVFSVSVNSAGSSDIMSYSYLYDNNAAKQAVDTFSYLLSSDLMQELICQELGRNTIGAKISASSVSGTNFFVLSATSKSAATAQEVCAAVMEVYPQVARKAIGEVQLIITQAPSLPTEPYNTLDIRSGAIRYGGIGFILGLILIFLPALARRTIVSSRDVKKMVNLDCIAHIPVAKRKLRKKNKDSGLLVSNFESDSAFSEAFRALRLKLLRSMDEDDKVIVVTSSVPSEGKSSIAVNMALTLARDGKKVLLIDADLRGPSVKTILGMTKTSRGLGEFLADSAKGNVEIPRYGDTGLYVFAGDKSYPNPTAMLRQQGIKNFIDSMRKAFDYIIIDTPPAVMMADSSSIAAFADKLVYVIREDFAADYQIFDGIQSLSDAGAEMCGFVLNYSSPDRISGYGKYGYGYGKYGYGRYGYGKYGYGGSSYGSYKSDKKKHD